MPRSIPLLLLLIAAGLAGAMYWLAKPKTAPSVNHTITALESGNHIPPLKQDAEKPPYSSSVNLPPMQKKAREYICNSDECASNPLMASSEKEAVWLIAHGYPSPVDLETWKGLSDDQLGRIARAGSLAAKAVHGERIAAKGDMNGLSELVEAAEQGSIYAYYGTSSIRSKIDMIEGAAFLRVAYMLGDQKASNALYDRFPELGPVDYYAIDRRAAELYKSYAHERQAKIRPN